MRASEQVGNLCHRSDHHSWSPNLPGAQVFWKWIRKALEKMANVAWPLFTLALPDLFFLFLLYLVRARGTRERDQRYTTHPTLGACCVAHHYDRWTQSVHVRSKTPSSPPSSALAFCLDVPQCNHPSRTVCSKHERARESIKSLQPITGPHPTCRPPPPRM